MKTRTNSFFKTLLLVLLVPTIMIGCGKENKSGSSSTAAITTDPWIGTNVNSSNANIALPSDWLNRLYGEYPCRDYYSNNGAASNARTIIDVQAPGPYQVNAGSLYTGVTLEGDILVISNQNNNIRAQVHSCNRPSQITRAKYITKPVLNISENCAMGEVTAADILLDSSNGVYHLAFFPAGMSARSTLCK